MTTMKVDAAAMARAGRELRAVGESCLGAAAETPAALALLALGSCDPQVAAAVAGAQQRWGEALVRCGAVLGGLGRAVEGAGAAYERAEGRAIGMFGEAHRALSSGDDDGARPATGAVGS